MTFLRNSNGDVEEFGYYVWNGSAWMKYFHFVMEYTYNGQNEITAMRRVSTSDVFSATTIRNAVYTLDANGNYIEVNYVDTLEQMGATYYYAAKDEISRDANGLETSRTYYSSAINTLAPLEEDDKVVFTINNNLITAFEEQYRDGSNSIWEGSDRTDYTFDANNNMTSETDQSYNGTGWENEEMKEWAYDSQDRLTSESSYIANGTAWDNDSKTSFFYLGTTSDLDYTLVDSAGAGGWTENFKTVVTYNTNNEPLYTLSYLWNGTGYDADAFARMLFTSGGTPVNNPPAAPSNLMASSVSRAAATRISLTWDDNSSDEDGFIIMRSMDSTTYTSIDSVGVDVTTYTDSMGLAGGTKYFYQLVSYNQYGASTPSNTASAVSIAVGTTELLDASISIFPNPSTGYFMVNGAKGNCMVTMTDLTGNCVMGKIINASSEKISTSGLPSGMYILSIESGQNSHIQKIVIRN